MSATFTVVDANNSVHSTTTIEHEGSLFTNGSGFVDFESGRLFAYWTQRPCKDPAYCATLKPHEHAHSQFDVTIGDGHKIADGVSAGFYKVHGFYGIRHYRYPVSFFLMEGDHDGQRRFTYWHGTAYGPGMYLRAKRSKRKQYCVSVHENVSRYHCCTCAKGYKTEYEVRAHVRFYCRG